MKKTTRLHLLIILIVGLLPLLWFKESTLIFGHDAGIPFEPSVHFLDRFHVWSQRFGIGTDQSAALLGAFFIHGLEYLLNQLPISLQIQQKIQFVFWFTLPGLTMYFFTSRIWPGKKYLALVSSIIYMLNYFLLQGWFIAERTKFSIYAALPLVTYFALSYLTKRMSGVQAILLAGLTLGLLNGGGSIPLYGGLLIVFFVTYTYILFLNPRLKTLLSIVIFSVGTGLVYILLNGYWILPYIFYVLSFYSRDLANAGGAEGVLNWATYLTQGSTLMNLLIGQGVPEWYLNEFHPYAKNILYNPLFIFISFSLLALFMTAIFVVRLAKDKFYLYLFCLIGMVAIIFSAGPNSPFGFIYELCVRYIPGFAMFRSSYYKFNYAVWFSYSILIAFSVEFLLMRLEKRKNLNFLVPIIIVVICVLYFGFHYPVLNGSFFDYNQNPNQKISNRINVPSYVFEFGKWVNKQDPNERYLLLPELHDSKYISYQWGYWSLAGINTLQSQNSFVQNTFLIPESGRILMKEMYAALRNRDFESFSDYLSVFAIDKIVLHKDVDWQNPVWGTTDPRFYERIIEESRKFTKEKEFGSWIVYGFNNAEENLRISSTSNLGYLQGKLNHIVSFPSFDPIAPFYMGGVEDVKKDEYYQKQATDMFITSECVECDGIEDNYKFDLYNPKLLPGSFLYPFITFNEEKVKKNANTFESLVNYYLTTSDRRAVELKWMVDSGKERNAIYPTILRYKENLRQLSDLVNSEMPVPLEQKNNILQKTYGHLITQQELIFSIYKNDFLQLQDREALEPIYAQLHILINIVDSKKWITRDLNEKKYITNLPVNGEYEVYIKHNAQEESNDRLNNSSLVINNDVTMNPIQIAGDWVYYGKTELKKGDVLSTFTDTSAVNLIGITPITYPFGRKGITISDDITTFTSSSVNTCMTLALPNPDLSGKDSYLVTFDYKNLTNDRSMFVFRQYGKIRVPTLRTDESYLAIKQDWYTHTDIVTPLENNMTYNICGGRWSSDNPDQEETGDNSINDTFATPIALVSGITLQKITYPNIVFYRQNIRSVDAVRAKNTYKKEDPVTYYVNLEKTSDSSSVVMRENFGKYWQVCWIEGDCLPFDDRAHFASFGLFNTWYFEDGLKGNLKLYYTPQRFYTYGSIISIIAVLVTGGTLWFYKLKKKQ